MGEAVDALAGARVQPGSAITADERARTRVERSVGTSIRITQVERESAADPEGWSLFKEGLCTLGFVLSSAKLTEEVGFETEGGVKRKIGSTTDGFDTGSDGEWSLGGDRLGEFAASREKVFCGYDLVDESDAEGFGGIDDLAGEK